MIEFALETAKPHGGLTHVEGQRAARETMLLYSSHYAAPGFLKKPGVSLSAI